MLQQPIWSLSWFDFQLGMHHCPYCCSAKYVFLKYCAILTDYYEWSVQKKLIFLHNIIIMIIRHEEMTVLN